MDSSSAGTSGLVTAGAASSLAGAKKRTKVVFLNPVEITNWDQIKENSKQNVIGENDLINYEKMLKDDDAALIANSGSNDQKRQGKKRGRPKGSRNGARKRPVDPSQPWLESSDSDEPHLGLEDELDDDEYFRRLEEEKMREDAEEESRKRREMEARAAARANAQGRRGSTKNDAFIMHQYQTSALNSSNINQRESSTRNKRRGGYAALAGLVDPSDSSEDISELDDKSTRSGYQKSLDDIHEQNEDELGELASSPFRQSVLDMLPPPPSPGISSNSEEVNSVVKSEPSDNVSSVVDSSNAATIANTTVASTSLNDAHTLKMLEMDPIELRFRAPPLSLPPSGNDLVCPREYLLDALSIYEVLRRYGSLLRLSPFRLEDFLACLISDENSNLLAETHMVLLKALLREDESNGTSMAPMDCKDSVNMTFYLLDRYNWPYLLANYLSSIKLTEAAARMSAINTMTGTGNIGGPTSSGGADAVLSAALFPDDLIPLNSDYPFVPIQSRIAVLRGLTNLFLATGQVRGDILREGLMAHEDYCRVCHQSGEVLCCDGCTSVFHLHCLNPPLSSVPTSSWICPVCVKQKTPGVTDCFSEAEKSGVAHYQEPIGKDRAGRLYWYISRRLIIEPVDFSQREPELMGFHDGVIDKVWEAECGCELIEKDEEMEDSDTDIDPNNAGENSGTGAVESTPGFNSNNNEGIDSPPSKSSNCDSQSVPVKQSDKKSRRTLQCNPSISYANEPCVYYYSSIEQVLRIRELLSTDWEPWLCYRLDMLLPRMKSEMTITQKLTENGLQQFCRLRPNHKSLSMNDPNYQRYANLLMSSIGNIVCVYSVLEVEQALCKKIDAGETNEHSTKKLAIAACSLPSIDKPVFPSLSNDLLSFLEKYTEDNSYVVLVTDQNSCIVRNHDQVISRISKEDNSNEVAVYPPTILEPQDLSTLHMPLDWNSSNPTPNECCLLAYRLSDEGSWRSWTNLYTSGVWTGEEKATATTTDGDADDGANKQHGDDADGDGIHDLKRTPSGTRNTQNPAAKTTTDEVDPDDMILDSVNVALTRAQHLEEKEKRRLLANKFNFSDYCSDLWQYIDPVTLASTYKGILRSMMEDKTAATTAAAFERIRFDCWPASPYQLLDLLRLTLCHMESKIPLAFFTPAWRAHRTEWIKDVLDCKSPSDLAFVLARLEASIRTVCFQRVWFSSLGHLNLERFTAAQREEDKRIRQFDRLTSSSSSAGGAGNAAAASLPANLIRTKTPHPIRHTVWKTRGEEYRRLGGDGWMWISSTRGNAGRVAQRAFKTLPPISYWRNNAAATSNRRTNPRGLQHGIGWGVCPEYIEGQIPVKPPKASECRGHVLHPITGIPLYLNPKRTSYTIPPDELIKLNEQIEKQEAEEANAKAESLKNSMKLQDTTEISKEVEKQEDSVRLDKDSNHAEKKDDEPMDSELKTVPNEVKMLPNVLKVEGGENNTDSDNQTSKQSTNTNDKKKPILNVSYCISHRIHFPPALQRPSVPPTHKSSSLSSSRRLNFHLDNLLQHRYTSAENDKKAGLVASSAVIKLQKEIEELENRHNEVLERLTRLGAEAQQARTAKAQAVKAKQNALLLVKPLPVDHMGSNNNNRLIQNTTAVDTTAGYPPPPPPATAATTNIGKPQLIQQSIVTNQGVRYRVLAPRPMPNIQMNQMAYNPMLHNNRTPASYMTTPSRSFNHNNNNNNSNNHNNNNNSRSARRSRGRRETDSSLSETDSDSLTPATTQRMDRSGRESLPVRRSARKVKAVRHDPDFIVDFDEDDDDDDGVDRKKANGGGDDDDDSDSFTPSEELHNKPGASGSVRKRSRVPPIHLNTKSSNRGTIMMPQYDGAGDTSVNGDDIGYDDDDDDDGEEEEDDDDEDEDADHDHDRNHHVDDDDDLDEYDGDVDGEDVGVYDPNELEEDEIVEDFGDDDEVVDYVDEDELLDVDEDEILDEDVDEEEEEDDEEYDDDPGEDIEKFSSVTSGKRIRLASQVIKKLPKVSSTVSTLPYTVQALNPDGSLTAPKVVILKKNQIASSNIPGSKSPAPPQVLSIPSGGGAGVGQRIILPAKVNGPNNIEDTSLSSAKVITTTAAMQKREIKEVGQLINPTNQQQPQQSASMPPQGLRLVKIVRNADGGTSIVPVSAITTTTTDGIQTNPEINSDSNNNNNNNRTIENENTTTSIMENKPTNKLDPADSSNSIRLVLSSGNGLTSFNLPKSSLMPTTTSESNEAKSTIMHGSLPATSVENDNFNTGVQPITISTSNISQGGFILTDVMPSTVTTTTTPSSLQRTAAASVTITSDGKLKMSTGNTVRFVIAPAPNSSFAGTNANQMATITVVKAPNQSDASSDSGAATTTITTTSTAPASNTTTSSPSTTSSSLPLILPRRPPAILRRTLAAGPTNDPLSSVNTSSSSGDPIASQSPSRTPSFASLIAANTARQLVCGGYNRSTPTTTGVRSVMSNSSIPTATPSTMDMHQGRRSMSKVQQMRHTLNDEDTRLVTNDSKILISEYQGGAIRGALTGLRQIGPTVKIHTPMMDETTLALDREVTEASAKLDSINAEIATVRSEAQELEAQIKSLKSELAKYQEIVNRSSPTVSAPYSLSLHTITEFDLSSRSFLNKFLRNTKKTVGGGSTTTTTTTTTTVKTEDNDSHMTVLPQFLPFVNCYSWPSNFPVVSQSSRMDNGEQNRSRIPLKSSLFRWNPRNLRSVILAAGRREIPGYDVEKKRLSQVNWLYPSSRPNFAESWRFRLSQIRTGCSGVGGPGDERSDNIFFGIDLANFALLLRTLWHCIRWDDILADPPDDAHVLDSSGQPCFKKTLDTYDDEEEDVNDEDDGGGGGSVSASGGGGGLSRRQNIVPYSVRRIVEIQPLDRYWLQANYKVRITTTRPNRYSGRGKKSTGNTDYSTTGKGGGRSARYPDSPDAEESSTSNKRRGRRAGQKYSKAGKDPDYDPAVDEGWRVGIPCSSSRRQSRQNGRSYGRSNRGSYYDSEDDDEHNGGEEYEGNRRGVAGQRHEVSIEEKWMSEDAVFPWEIRVFMNTLLPPKSAYPPVGNDNSSESNTNDKDKYIISARLTSLPLMPSQEDSNMRMVMNTSTSAAKSTLMINTTTAPTAASGSGASALMSLDHPMLSPGSYVEKDGFLYDGQSKSYMFNNNTTSRRSALASALQSGRTPGSSRSRHDDHSGGGGGSQQVRQLSPNTLEAKARARSIAATNAARASVAARRARFERALLEQRVRVLKTEYTTRKRLIFNWAKSLADIAVNEIKGNQLGGGNKSEQPAVEVPVRVEQSSTTTTTPATKTATTQPVNEKSTRRKARPPVAGSGSNRTKSSNKLLEKAKKKPGRPKKITNNNNKNNKNKTAASISKKSKRKLASPSSLSSSYGGGDDDEMKTQNSDEDDNDLTDSIDPSVDEQEEQENQPEWKPSTTSTGAMAMITKEEDEERPSPSKLPLVHSRPPRKSALNHEFIKISKHKTTSPALKLIQSELVKSPIKNFNTPAMTTPTPTTKTATSTTTTTPPASKKSLTMKLSLKGRVSTSSSASNSTSACSTPSTSPGLGDYEDNYRIKSKMKNQKLTIKIKKESSTPTKVKKSKHTKSISDAIDNNNNNGSTTVKSPRPSSIGSGGGGGSSRGRGGGRGGRGGGASTTATTGGSSRKGRPKISAKLEQEDKQHQGHDEQRQPQQEQKSEPVVSFPPQSKSESPVNTTPTTTTTNTTGLYCLCKTPYDQSREYIGCDLCRDWFHFECVGLDPKDAHKLGDSWHCPDCKQAELKANEMLYCVCRTSYQPTRVYIACDGCDEWYHPECVGLTPEEAVNHEDTYLCPTCRESTAAAGGTTTTTTKSSNSSRGRTSKSKAASNHYDDNSNNNGNTLEDTSAIHPVTGAKTIYATHLNTDSIQRLIHLVDEIKKHKMSWPFVTTPDPIKFPIVNTLNSAFNLPNVIINLKTGVYKTLGDFSFDMNRLFTNSRLIYPKDTSEFNCTEIIEALFVQKMRQFKETL